MKRYSKEEGSKKLEDFHQSGIDPLVRKRLEVREGKQAKLEDI